MIVEKLAKLASLVERSLDPDDSFTLVGGEGGAEVTIESEDPADDLPRILGDSPEEALENAMSRAEASVDPRSPLTSNEEISGLEETFLDLAKHNNHWGYSLGFIPHSQVTNSRVWEIIIGKNGAELLFFGTTLREVLEDWRNSSREKIPPG